VGTNIAFRRSVFEDIGTFDPGLGRKGEASLLSNEEIALIRKAGLDKVFYIPDMVVEHIISDERISLEWFRKRVFWQAVSDVLAGDNYKDPVDAAAELHRAVARAPAEHRGHRLVSYRPSNPEEFKNQLSVVYLQAVLMAGGFPAAAT
jgi:hypothetical protein